MLPPWRCALLGSLWLVYPAVCQAASPTPTPSPTLRCSLAAPVHGRAAIQGPCRIAESALRQATVRLSWEITGGRDTVAGRLAAGPLEAAPAAAAKALWGRPQLTGNKQGGTERPFLGLATLVELPFGDDVLIQLTEGGFERRFDVFLTGRRQGGEIVVTGALEPVFQVSIGDIQVLETHALDGDEALLVGRTSGGDNGEVWGSVWLAWLAPSGFRVMVDEPYFWDSNAVGERRVEAQFSTADLEIRFQDLEPGRSDDDPAAWRTVSARAFDLRPLIADARRAPGAVLAGTPGTQAGPGH